MRIFYVLVITAIITSCATTRTLSNVNPGMSFNEVNSVMGKRDSFQLVEKDGDEYTLFKWNNHLCSEWAWDRCSFLVVFKNGKVVESGVFNITQREAPRMNTLHIFNY